MDIWFQQAHLARIDGQSTEVLIKIQMVLSQDTLTLS